MNRRIFLCIMAFHLCVFLHPGNAQAGITDTDAKEILNVLGTVERAMDERNVELFMSVIHQSYGDTVSNYDRLKMTMSDSFKTFTSIGIRFFNVRVSSAPKGVATMTDEFVVDKEYKPKNRKIRDYGKDVWTLKKDEKGIWKVVHLKTEILE